VDPLALLFPDAMDGVLGVAFVAAAIASSAAAGAWTNAVLSLDRSEGDAGA